MTREAFLTELCRQLSDLPQNELEQHLTYYAEMMADRMEEGMTEEQAVASMEPISRIAQQILRDRQAEGVPPSYPPPPRTNAPMGSAEKPPRKRPKWLIPVIAAAVILILIPSLIFTSLLAGARSGFYIGPEGIKIGGIYIGPEGVHVGRGIAVDDEGVRVGALEISDQGIRLGTANSSESTTDTVIAEAVYNAGVTEGNAAVMEGTENTFQTAEGSTFYYTRSDHGSEYGFIAADVSEIEIDWVSGYVDVCIGTDDGPIYFQEYSDSVLTEKTALRYTLKNGKLKIDYCEEDIVNVPGEKTLTVLLPESLCTSNALEKLEIETTSASMSVVAVNAKKLELDTTSGNCDIHDGNFNKISADTVSGDVSIYSNVEEVEFDSTSGSLWLDGASNLRQLEADTVSGQVMLTLDSGDFTLDWDTVSGSINSSYDMTAKNNNRFIGGTGDMKLKVSTTSGNLCLD